MRQLFGRPWAPALVLLCAACEPNLERGSEFLESGRPSSITLPSDEKLWVGMVPLGDRNEDGIIGPEEYASTGPSFPRGRHVDVVAIVRKREGAVVRGILQHVAHPLIDLRSEGEWTVTGESVALTMRFRLRVPGCYEAWFEAGGQEIGRIGFTVEEATVASDETGWEVAPQARWAVVAGINGYDDEPLNFCVADARLTARSLILRGGYSCERVLLLTDDQPNEERKPSRENILKAIRLVALLAGPRDCVTVYLSGHGTERGGQSFFVPIDAGPGGAELINLGEVRAMLAGSRAPNRLLVVDACRSGSGRIDSSDLMPAEFMAALGRDTHGVATMTSCQIDEASIESSALGHGLFTYWLASGLTGAADRFSEGDGDGSVSLAELHRFVLERVSAGERDQHPQLVGPASTHGLTISVVGRAEGLGKRFSNSVGMELSYVPPGTFMMGSPSTESGRDEDERIHPVTLTSGFYMGRTEVTCEQWSRFVNDTGYVTLPEQERAMGYRSIDRRVSWREPWPSSEGTVRTDHPVVGVGWEEAQAFCQWLSEREGRRYRLPSEAEWEYACRAGGREPYGAAIEPEEIACSTGDRDREKHSIPRRVGRGTPNAWGFFDMHGNVLEWCADAYHEFPPPAQMDPLPAVRSDRRVTRGGCYHWGLESCRAAARSDDAPRTASRFLGFRVLLEAIDEGDTDLHAERMASMGRDGEGERRATMNGRWRIAEGPPGMVMEFALEGLERQRFEGQSGAVEWGRYAAHQGGESPNRGRYQLTSDWENPGNWLFETTDEHGYGQRIHMRWLAADRVEVIDGDEIHVLTRIGGG